MSGTGVVCRDCPYQDIWYPVRTDREKCKHDLVHDDHHVDYVDPSDVTKSVTMEGEVVVRHDEQSQLVTDGGRATSDAGTQQSEEEFQETVTGEIRGRFEEKEPSEEEKAELRKEHLHHEVRDTTSQLSVDAARDIPGVEVDAEIEVPDLYCFTCEEWVGLSGIELRGTPRSKKDSYYLGGPPEDVAEARQTVREHLTDLAEHALANVETVTDAEDALEFVEDEAERLSADLAEVQ